MKKVLVVGRKNAGEKNDALQLSGAIATQTKEAEVVGAYYEDIVIRSHKEGSTVVIKTDTGSLPLASFDVVLMINWSHHRLYTDIAHSIALIAKQLGVTVWNDELLYARSSTKVSQLVLLSYENVEIPASVFSLTPRLAREYISSLGTPFVAKDPLASRGRNNFLCSSWDEFERVADAQASYVFQEFIPNDTSDLRMFVAGGEAVLAIWRKGTGESHLNNVSQGASAKLIALDTLPPKLLEETKRIAKKFNRQLCGIDFMKNTQTDTYMFLEINTTPQIVNGVFAEEKAAAMARALTR